jgi:hypothetical protein
MQRDRECRHAAFGITVHRRRRAEEKQWCFSPPLFLL